MPPDVPRPPRLRLGHVEVDALTLAGAVDAVEGLVAARKGGVVVTPNIDHVVRAERDPAFREAYAAADLSIADGQPLVWSSWVLGPRLPERVAGADLLLPLMGRAAERRWRVFLLGAGPGVAELAGARLRELGVDVVGTAAPAVASDPLAPDPGGDEAAATVRAARPDVVVVAFGAPKQELWMHRHRAALAPAVLLGLGASLDFVAGRVRRAPPWISRAGLEWAWRLAHEPRRLWRRYLVEDPWFAIVVLRELRGRVVRR